MYIMFVILANFFLSDPRFKDEVPVTYLSHQEHYEQAIRKACIFYKKIKEWEEISNTHIFDIFEYV